MKQSGRALVCVLAVRIFIERTARSSVARAAFSSPSRICVLPSEVRRVLEIARGKFEGAQRAVSRAPRVGHGLARQKSLGEQFLGLKIRAGFDAIAQQSDRLVELVGNGPREPTRLPMTPDAAAQLAILADALTEIVDLATGGEKKVLARAGDTAGLASP